MQFGYLPWSDLETGALRTDQELRRAIRNFQRIAGLKQTGKFDEDTHAIMLKPRCGMADLLDVGKWSAADSDGSEHPHRHGHGEIRASAGGGGHVGGQWRPQEYTFGPSKWNKTQLTFRISSFSPDLSIAETRGAIHRALRLWSDVSKLTFHEVQTGHADIIFQFATGYHHDGYPFDGQGMVLAHAFFPGEDRGGDVHFDDDESWTVYTEEGVDLFMVAAHELGHALGLAHSTTTGSLMFPWHQGYIENYQLHDDDVSAIQQLYGASHSSPGRQRPPQSHTVPPPTRRPYVEPTPRQHHPTREPTKEQSIPDACNTNFDAVSVIRGQMFAFKDKWFWRIIDSGVMEGHPVEISRFWYGLPRQLGHIDAVYERRSDGRIVFFSGREYWSFSGTERHEVAGRPLTDFGLPDDIDRVDAVFVWGHNQRTYVIAGGMYWKLGAEEHSTLTPIEIHGYPRDMSMWAGVPLPIDSAFTSSDGRTYFFKGQQFWEFNNVRMRVQHGFPRQIGRRWLHCTRTEDDGTRLDQDPSSPASGSSVYCVPFMTYVVAIIKTYW